MKLQHVVAIILLLILLGSIFWLLGRQGEPQSVSVSPQEMAFLDRAEEVRYRGEGGDIIVKYADEVVRIVGGNYDQVVLRQVPAASGVKYEGELGLTLWTKGDEVRIETPQELVFVGLEVTEAGIAEIPEVPVDIPVATTTADAVTALDTKWFWKQAMLGGEVVTAAQPEEFAITFMTDGQVVGDTDCNGFGGSYTRENDTFILGEFMSTLMFCEDSQEDVFRGFFTTPITIESVSETKMMLRNGAGDTAEFAVTP
jgi:heat shock protein HslJ/membrane-bound inhibitor of C-type lysozyme